MARTNKTDLKALFNNGDILTESSMENLIDSFDPSSLDLVTNDPITDGVEADINTEGVAPDGTRWKKVGAGDNDWEQIIMASNFGSPVGTGIISFDGAGNMVLLSEIDGGSL